MDYARPRASDDPLPTPEDNIRHLTECDGCALCDDLMNFYEACDTCGAWGHMDAMQGIVQGCTATVLCFACMIQYTQDPESIVLIDPPV